MGSVFLHFEQQVQNHPDKTALVYGGTSYTYSELLQQAHKWAERLSLTQASPPRVAILCDSAVHNITISLGLAKLNATSIPTNSALLPEQLRHLWKSCDVNVVIYEPEQAALVQNCNLGGVMFISIDDELSTLPPKAKEVSYSNDQEFLITFSSGSTGQPKPIVISQKVKLGRAQQAWGLYRLTHDDVVLCASPFYHSLGQRHVFVTLLLGATLVYMERFSPREWIDLVARHKVTFVTAVSSHLYALKHSLINNAEQLKSLKTLVTSSAPIDAQFKNDLFNTINCQFHEIYGTSEIACATNLFPQDAHKKSATVGTVCDNVDIKIFDTSFSELPIGQIGQIAISSPLTFESYYNQPDLTGQAFKDGYFLTGDLGFKDEDGFLTYVGRQKDVIISGGINVYPKDIEEQLSTHDLIDDVAVIGVKDDLLGEVVVAVCVTQAPPQIEMELRRIANEHLAAFQRPLKYFFVESLPLTGSGKISKQVLRETYAPLNDGWTAALRSLVYGT